MENLETCEKYEKSQKVWKNMECMEKYGKAEKSMDKYGKVVCESPIQPRKVICYQMTFDPSDIQNLLSSDWKVVRILPFHSLSIPIYFYVQFTWLKFSFKCFKCLLESVFLQSVFILLYTQMPRACGLLSTQKWQFCGGRTKLKENVFQKNNSS